MTESEKLQKLQSDWFEFANGDLTGAKILFNAGGASNTIGLLLQQAIEKYLKGYLLGKGWELVKTHNIEFLLVEASRYDKRFEAYFEFGRAVTALYAEDRYPFINQMDVPMKRLREMIETGERLIEMIKEGA